VADVYEIRIRGALSDAVVRQLADRVRAFEPTETVLRGQVADQAELRGVLARLQELGCELLEARRLSPRPPRNPAPPTQPPGDAPR
jgi:hypothetical protein